MLWKRKTPSSLIESRRIAEKRAFEKKSGLEWGVRLDAVDPSKSMLELGVLYHQLDCTFRDPCLEKKTLLSKASNS